MPSGKKGKFTALAANQDLFLSKDFPLDVVARGLAGPIDVKGDKIDNEMPPSDFPSDDEVAAAVNYVRSNSGNDKLAPAGSGEVTAAVVAGVRAKESTGEEVHALRRSLMKQEIRAAPISPRRQAPRRGRRRSCRRRRR